jgi:hypothetical protein
LDEAIKEALSMANESNAERYRQAAEDALQQLQWCTGYLHGIRKSQLSARLAQNSRYIKRKLMKEPAQTSPSGITSET